jgi:hypothetical protein
MKQRLCATLEVFSAVWSGTPFFWDVTHEDESTTLLRHVWNQLPSGILSHPRRMSPGTSTSTAITVI